MPRSIALASMLLLLPACATQRAARSSRCTDTTVSIDGGPSFSIPRSFVDEHRRHGPTMFLHPAADLAGPTGGEFDREYAELVDGIFDLRDCAFQGSDDGWGAASVTYLNLTVRVYRLDGDAAANADRAAARAAHPPRRSVDGDWHHLRWHFALQYSDYAAGACVDVHLHEGGGRTIAFVFLHPDIPTTEATIRQILASIRW